MARVVPLAVAVTALTGAGLWCPAAESGPRPRMVLAETVWDFGKLEEGQTATKSIKISNVGNADLRITFVRSSCSACTGSAATRDAIPPGGTGEIKLTFYSKGLEGKQTKKVYVHCNDAAHPFEVVTVKGTVHKGPKAELAVTPTTLDLGLVSKGRRRSGKLTVRNTGEKPLTIRKVTPSEGCRVTGTPTKPIGPGKGVELRVTIDAARPAGLIQEYVTVESDAPVGSAATILVTGYVAPGAAGALSRGVVISPKGEGVHVPGTDTVFYPKYRITNSLAAPIRISLTRSEGDRGEEKDLKEIGPGEELVVDVPAADGKWVPLAVLLPREHPKGDK